MRRTGRGAAVEIAEVFVQVRSLLRTVHAKHALLVAAAAVGAGFLGWPAAGSVMLGGTIQAVNLGVLERSVRLILADENASSGLSWVVVILRFGLVLTAAVWALTLPGTAPLALGLGLAMILPATSWHALTERKTA